MEYLEADRSIACWALMQTRRTRVNCFSSASLLAAASRILPSSRAASMSLPPSPPPTSAALGLGMPNNQHTISKSNVHACLVSTPAGAASLMQHMLLERRSHWPALHIPYA